MHSGFSARVWFSLNQMGITLAFAHRVVGAAAIRAGPRPRSFECFRPSGVSCGGLGGPL